MFYVLTGTTTIMIDVLLTYVCKDIRFHTFYKQDIIFVRYSTVPVP